MHTWFLATKSMTTLINHRSWQWRFLVLFIGLFAFGFRYYYVIHAEVFQPVYQPNVRADAVEYYAYARNLTQHGVFSKALPGTFPLTRDSYRDPGYPFFLAGWMKVFTQWDNWYAAVLLSQATSAPSGAVNDTGSSAVPAV